MYKILSFRVLLILFLFCLSFCKKGGHTYTISENLKQWCAFQPGSYWIYKNDSTGSTDSAYLKYPAQSGFINIGGTEDVYEDIKLDFVSQVLYEYRLTFECSIIQEDNLDRFRIYTHISNVVLIAFDPHIPLNTVVLPCGTDDGHFMMNHFDSVQLNGISYKDVTVSKEWSNDSSSFLDNIYLAKNIGLIKIQIKTIYAKEISWSLLRYKINIK